MHSWQAVATFLRVAVLKTTRSGTQADLQLAYHWYVPSPVNAPVRDAVAEFDKATALSEFYITIVDRRHGVACDDGVNSTACLCTREVGSITRATEVHLELVHS